MDEPSGGTLRFSGHWILTNVFVTQVDILTSVPSILIYMKTSPNNRTLPYLFVSFLLRFLPNAPTPTFSLKGKRKEKGGGRSCAYALRPRGRFLRQKKTQISQLRQVT